MGGARTGRVAAAGTSHARALTAGLGVVAVLGVVAAIVWGLARGDDDPVARAVRPSVSLSPEPSGAGVATGEAAVAAAEASLADALEGEGLLSREQAECAAGQWIENAGGLDEMVAAGLFDETYEFVDVPAAELSPAMQSAAAAATVICAAS